MPLPEYWILEKPVFWKEVLQKRRRPDEGCKDEVRAVSALDFFVHNS